MSSPFPFFLHPHFIFFTRLVNYKSIVGSCHAFHLVPIALKGAQCLKHISVLGLETSGVEIPYGMLLVDQ